MPSSITRSHCLAEAPWTKTNQHHFLHSFSLLLPGCAMAETRGTPLSRLVLPSTLQHAGNGSLTLQRSWTSGKRAIVWRNGTRELILVFRLLLLLHAQLSPTTSSLANAHSWLGPQGTAATRLLGLTTGSGETLLWPQHDHTSCLYGIASIDLQLFLLQSCPMTFMQGTSSSCPSM